MLGKTWGRAIKCLSFVGFAAAAAASAQAGYTQVNAVAPGGELGHADILSRVYGGTFAADAGVHFTNGAVTAMRCEDFGDALTLDQCWQVGGGITSARALARFAGYEQKLGVFDGEAGGAFRELLAVSGSGMNVSGSATGLSLDGTYRFARGGGGAMMTSRQADNLAAADQMVSYRLSGAGAADKYVLFFEDAGAGDASDWDFNDMVVELSTAPAALIPLPPAVWSGLLVLLTGGLWNARGDLRRWFIS